MMNDWQRINPFPTSLVENEALWKTRLPIIASIGIDTLQTKSRKFTNDIALRWTLGSILFLSSFAAVMGPWTYVLHLASTPRLPFTAAYFGSLGLTIYFSIGVSQPRVHSKIFVLTPSKLHSTILTLLSALVQLACLIWYLVSYFPMGSSGLRLATTFGARRAAAWMSG